MFRAPCVHHQEVKIALHSLRYHHIYRWPSRAQVERGLYQPTWCTKFCFTISFISCLHIFRTPFANHQRRLSQPVHGMATYTCDDTRGCVTQLWPLDDEDICSKHVEAWNKFYCKTNFCAWSWLISKIKPKKWFLNRFYMYFNHIIAQVALQTFRGKWSNFMYIIDVNTLEPQCLYSILWLNRLK